MRSPLQGITRSKETWSSAPRSFPIEQLEERLLLAANPMGPLDLDGDPRIDPDDFRVTAFATGLNFPVSMQQLSDGSLLVGTAKPSSPEAGFFNATTELIRLVDADGDGVADDSGQIVFSGLPGAVTSVRKADDLLFIATTNFSGPERRISLLRAGSDPGDPYTLIGHIEFAPRPNSIHETKTLAVRDTPGEPGSYDLVFGVGSVANDTETTDPVDVSGMITASINADSIYMVTVDNTGATPALSNLTQIAAGVRNSAGILFHPTTGDLYFADNNFNDPNEPGEPISTDELNVIDADDIDGDIEDFGFPGNYIVYRTGEEVGSGSVQPLVTFQPVSSTAPVEESEGPSEIAFAPPGFPAGLDNGIFIGFHGQGSAGTGNRENPVVYVDLDTGEYFHFVGVDSAGVGHLDGILSTDDSLFLADISSNGNLTNANGAGVIYQIRALPNVDDDTVGLYDPEKGAFYLRGENSAGYAEVIFGMGPANADWMPLSGDWDGDGNNGVGLFNPEGNQFFLQNTHATGTADVGFRYGPVQSGWLPIAGDWDGDQDDSVGLYDPVGGKFFLIYGNGAGVADLVYGYGPKNVDWLPVAGDWNGDGMTTVGLFDPDSGVFFLKNSHEAGAADMTFRFGPVGSGWIPISGDWNRDGVDTVGLYNPVTSSYYLTDTHTPGPADTLVHYGPAGEGWMPLMGKWGLTFTIQSSEDSSSSTVTGNPFSTSGAEHFGLLAASSDSNNLSPAPMPSTLASQDGGLTPVTNEAEGQQSSSSSDDEPDSATTDMTDEDDFDAVLEAALLELADELMVV